MTILPSPSLTRRPAPSLAQQPAFRSGAPAGSSRGSARPPAWSPRCAPAPAARGVLRYARGDSSRRERM